jgi:hypothetical protein
MEIVIALQRKSLSEKQGFLSLLSELETNMGSFYREVNRLVK